MKQVSFEMTFPDAWIQLIVDSLDFAKAVISDFVLQLMNYH